MNRARGTSLTWTPADPAEARRFRLALAAILALALLIRLAFVLVIPQPENAIGDSAEFDLLARNLLAGHGLSYEPPWLPSARRTPLYPLLLAATYRLFGLGQATPLLLAQAAADTATVALTGWLAWQAWRERRIGLLASLLAALYLPAAQLAGRLLADSFFSFLMVAGVSLFVAAADSPAPAKGRARPIMLAALSGLAFGLATLARPTALPLPWLLGGVGLLASFKLQASHFKLHTSMVASLVLASLLVMLPWFARNYFAFGRLVTGSTLVGFNFYQTHYRLDQPDYTSLPGVSATGRALRAALRSQGIEPNDLDEAALYDEAMALGLAMVERYPARFLHLVAWRSGQLWFNLGFGGRPSPATWLFAAANAFLLLLAFLAQWRFLAMLHAVSRFTNPYGRPPGRVNLYGALLVQATCWLILLYFTASHAVIIAAGRYFIPVAPFLLALAAGAAQPLLIRRRSAGVSHARSAR